MNPATIMAWFIILFPALAFIVALFKKEEPYYVYVYCDHGTHYSVECPHCDNRIPIERMKK